MHTIYDTSLPLLYNGNHCLSKLHVCLSINSKQNFSLLVSLAEVDTKCYDAFDHGRKEEALRLLKQVKDPHTVKNKNNFTILHCAAHNGWLDVVKELIIEYQFDPDCKDNDGYTPFRTASNSGKQDVVEYLETVIGTFVVHFYLFIYNCLDI